MNVSFPAGRAGVARRVRAQLGAALLAGALGSVAAVASGALPQGPTRSAKAAASTADPQAATYFARQWGLEQVDAPLAWRYGTGSGVRIGIVDTGVDLGHPDLAGKVVAAATCLNTNGDPALCVTSAGAGQDDNGHGTHVAGIAAAAGNGVAGVAPGASLVVAKVLDSSGSGSTADVAAGIEWVVEHGARVVNLSLGSSPGFLGIDCIVGGCGTSLISAAVESAWQAGAIPVIAAGNNAGDLFGPDGYGNLDAVVVAATGPSGQFASDYSSTPGNAKWGVLAPGGDDANGPTTPTCGVVDASEILSTYWSNGSCYATDEGTSMATPFVSGTLALLLGLGLDQSQAVQALLSTLKSSVACGSGQGCLGLLDAGAAMQAAAKDVPGPSQSGRSSPGRSTVPGPAEAPSRAAQSQPGEAFTGGAPGTQDPSGSSVPSPDGGRPPLASGRTAGQGSKPSRFALGSARRSGPSVLALLAIALALLSSCAAVMAIASSRLRRRAAAALGADASRAPTAPGQAEAGRLEPLPLEPEEIEVACPGRPVGT